MEPLTIFAALIPPVIDAVKSIVAKKTDGRPPVANAAEYAQLVEADIKRLQAIAELDKPAGPVSQWVNNVRAMQRPPVVFMVLGAWVLCAVGIVATLPENFKLVSDMAGAIFFYLFGDRVNAHWKK